MYIAIISDIHDNVTNLTKCLDWCRQNKIDRLICCGDVTNSTTLRFLTYNFLGPIHLVRGNVNLYDEDRIAQYKNIINYGRIGRFELAGKTIGICHEPYLVEYVLKQGFCDVVFYGHTHDPWEEKRGRTLVVNPGTLGGVLQRATFATWDIKADKLELKILDKI